MYFIILRLFGFGIITLVVIGWIECSAVSVGCRGFDLGLLPVSLGSSCGDVRWIDAVSVMFGTCLLCVRFVLFGLFGCGFDFGVDC